MKHPGNPAKMPPGHVPYREIREWEHQCAAGMICWFCVDPAVATLVKTSMEPVFNAGEWVWAPVHRPVCGPGYCRYGYGP